MKTKQLTRLVAALALSALALTACNKGTGNSNNTNNANNTNATSNSGSAANKNAAATTSGKGDYSSPTAAMKTFYEAAKGNDTEGIKRSMSKKSLSAMEKAAAKDNKTVDESLKEMIKDAPANQPEMRNEKIEGDKATLEMKDEKMDKWDTVPFVREDGQWKIAIFDEMAEM
ncbi:MAG: DUF4878 domain-containing protein, partial [Acidobacteria bacterium]|nr:DUF4878 domain-containing protein [Acidobacteriota bacterium]